MNGNLHTLIAKYAIVTATTYALEYGFSIVLNKLVIDPESYSLLYSRFYGFGLTVVLNIILALIIYSDSSRLNIKAPYAVLATIVCRPIGVFAFLIYAIIAKNNPSEAGPIDGVIDR